MTAVRRFNQKKGCMPFLAECVQAKRAGAQATI